MLAGMEQLKGLLSHIDPHMTLGQLVGRLVQEGLDRHHPSRPRRVRRAAGQPADAEQTSAPKRPARSTGITGSPAQTRQCQDQEGPSSTNGSARPVSITSSAPKSQRDMDREAPSAAKRPARPACATTSARKSCAPGRAIPAAVKREIWQRDGGRCGYIDPRRDSAFTVSGRGLHTGRKWRTRGRIFQKRGSPSDLGFRSSVPVGKTRSTRFTSTRGSTTTRHGRTRRISPTGWRNGFRH